MFESDSTALNWRESEAAGLQRGNHRCFFTALTWWNPWGVHCTSFSTSFSWNWTNKYKNPAAQHGGWWDTAAWGPRCSFVRPTLHIPEWLFEINWANTVWSVCVKVVREIPLTSWASCTHKVIHTRLCKSRCQLAVTLRVAGMTWTSTTGALNVKT